MKNYSYKDKICPHCGGNLSGHLHGDKVIIWCDNCGSNNKNVPPSVGIELTNPGGKK
jgi:hypothetical protein